MEIIENLACNRSGWRGYRFQQPGLTFWREGSHTTENLLRVTLPLEKEEQPGSKTEEREKSKGVAKYTKSETER